MKASVWIYLWDLIDEGVPQVLDRLQDNNIKGINVAVNYHSGRFFLPHNPKRKLHFPEPGALYIQPDPSWYDNSKIKPPISKFASKEIWEELRKETLKRNMTLTAWSLALHNSYIGFNYTESNVVNAFGDYDPTGLCPANKDVRKYLVDFYTDLSKNYDFDNILIESLEFMPFRHGYHHEVIGVPVSATEDFFMSLSFSEAICEEAKSNGIDIDAVRSYVRNKCNEGFAKPFDGKVEMTWEEIASAVDGQMKAYLDLREDLIASLLKDISSAISVNSNAKISVLDFGPLYPLGPNGVSWQSGANIENIANFADEIHPTFYFPEIEVLRSKVDEYVNTLNKVSQKIDVVPAIRAILPQVGSQESLQNQVDCLRPYSAGMTFYNYGFMAYETLDWIANVTKEK